LTQIKKQDSGRKTKDGKTNFGGITSLHDARFRTSGNRVQNGGLGAGGVIGKEPEMRTRELRARIEREGVGVIYF